MSRMDKDQVFEKAKEIVADLVTATVKGRGLTQEETAEIVDDAATQISLVMHRRLYAFSFDRLVRWLIALGWNVRIEITQARQARGRLTVQVQQPQKEKVEWRQKTSGGSA